MPAEPLVIQVMRQFKAGLLVRDAAQMRQMASRWLELERALDNHITGLSLEIDRILRTEGTVPTWRIYELERYRALQRQLREEVLAYADYADGLIASEQRTLGRLGIEQAAQVIEVQDVRLRGAFDVLPVEAIEHMVGLAGNGSPLHDLLVESWPDAAAGLERELLRGVAMGWHPDRVAKAMREGMAHGLNRAMTIARSEQLRVYRMASLDEYAHSGVVMSQRRLAAKDNRVCAACLAADGEEMGLGEPIYDHPNGRCVAVPVVDGVPRPEWELGRDWLMRQDVATQQAILGKGRYKAWQEGKFDLDALVTVQHDAVWGKSLQPTPLRDLV